MNKILIRTVFYCVFLFGWLAPFIAHGAEIKYLNSNTKDHSGNYRIVGTIQHGDFEKFLEIATAKNERPGSIWITSPGGNVEEALKFGRFAYEMSMSCMVSEQCNSSCFLIVAGCPDRTVTVDIGIHRPYFNPDDFGKLPFKEAQNQYDKLLVDISSYLQKMNVPRNLIDSMISVPSDSAKFLPRSEFEEKVGKRPPAYYEWLKAKCGGISDKEKDDIETISSAELFETIREWAQTNELDKDQIQTLQYTKKKWDEMQKMSKGYRTYLIEKMNRIEVCEENAVKQEAELRWKQLMDNKP